MYAVIQSGGKQYKVEVGDRLKLESLGIDEGETVEFDKVLAVGGDGGLEIGTPHLATSVTGKVLANGKGRKIRVIKFKRRKNYERTHGHRQLFTEVEITGIGGVSAASASADTAAVASAAGAAAAFASEPADTATTSATAEADDLTRISGVGPVLVEKLHALGITTFQQIADFTPERIAEVDEQLNFKGRIEREEWVAQAKKLAADS